MKNYWLDKKKQAQNTENTQNTENKGLIYNGIFLAYNKYKVKVKKKIYF